MICGLWFYHLTFCHVNPFLLYPPSAATEFEAIFHLSWSTLKSFRSLYSSACWCLALFLDFTRKQGTASEPPRPLVLTEAIATPAVAGTILTISDLTGKNQLFVAALGNNNRRGDRHQRALAVAYDYGDSDPQGVVYAPDAKETFCGQQQGEIANLWR